MATNPLGVARDAGDIQRISEDQAASQIDALLADDPSYEDDTEQETEQKSTKPVETQVEETEEVEAAKETQTEEEPEGESEVEAVEIDFDEPMFEVEEGGERVSLNQLKKNSMLQSDYTRKTQELAKQRAEVQEQLSKGINQQRQEYVQALDAQKALVMQMLIPEVQNLDQLAEEDPAEYIRAQNKRNKMEEVIRQIDEQKSSEFQKYQEFLRTDVLPKEMELTKQKIPDWSDDMKSGLIEVGKKYGFSDEELGAVIDHRYIHLLHDLSRLTKAETDMKSKKEISRKKVIAKPKVVKPGTRSKQDSSGESFKKLQKSGRFQDAADVFAERLGDLGD